MAIFLHITIAKQFDISIFKMKNRKIEKIILVADPQSPTIVLALLGVRHLSICRPAGTGHGHHGHRT